MMVGLDHHRRGGIDSANLEETPTANTLVSDQILKPRHVTSYEARVLSKLEFGLGWRISAQH